MDRQVRLIFSEEKIDFLGKYNSECLVKQQHWILTLAWSLLQFGTLISILILYTLTLTILVCAAWGSEAFRANRNGSLLYWGYKHSLHLWWSRCNSVRFFICKLPYVYFTRILCSMIWLQIQLLDKLLQKNIFRNGNMLSWNAGTSSFLSSK